MNPRSDFVTTEFACRRLPTQANAWSRLPRRRDPARSGFRLPETLAIMATLAMLGYFGVNYAFTSLNATVEASGYASQTPIVEIDSTPAARPAVALR